MDSAAPLVLQVYQSDDGEHEGTSGGMNRRVNVFITVDTEHSIGGAFKDPKLKPVGNKKHIYCQKGTKFYGIPLMMDIATRYGIRLTFFVEVFNKYYFGEDETREVCEYILKKNHDVQLHIHPNYLNFTMPDPCQIYYSDLIGNYSLSRQIEFLEEGKETLLQFGVPLPIAFRAGCFGANVTTLQALKQTNFIIDSSYNTAFLGDTCLFSDMKINDLIYLDGIWEFPITNFGEITGLRKSRAMSLDINGVSFREVKWILQKAAEKGPKNVTIILHSFSFIKPYDVQYNRTRVRRNVITRAEKLFRFLAENSKIFNVITFGDLAPLQLGKMSRNPVRSIPKVPTFLSLLRGFEQLLDNVI